MEPPRSNSAGAGVDWIGQGWRLFARSPLMWVVSVLVLFVIAIVVNLVPFIGQIAFQLLQPVFAAGFIVACRSLETGSEFEIEHLFAGFKRNFGSLLVVGLALLAGMAVLFVVFALFAGFGVVMSMMSGNATDMVTAGVGSIISILLGLLVMLLLMVPLLMFYWFAPALVMMHDMAPLTAMKESFRGCLRNILPFLIYGFVMFVLSILAVIPAGLGMLVWVPLAISSSYVAYRSIYTEESVPAEPAMARAA
ncbi:MAG TPA: BPSS1780 family membrane protein [Usitatibacter sp.]|nr:BPSS1780 family membrane protein [Usitatibacter sp.]